MKQLILIATAVAAITATSSSAATLDFIAEANGNERGVTDNTTINSANFGNIPVTFSATGGVAYFDHGNAGLGVCTNWTATASNNDNECSPGSDDNLTNGETVTIAFESEYRLSNLMFQAEGHKPMGVANASDLARTLTFAINGGAMQIYTFADLMGQSFDNVMSATFGFDSTGYSSFFDSNGKERQTAGNGQQYYLASAVVNPVPVPAGLPLLLAGLGGFGLLARKRKQAD